MIDVFSKIKLDKWYGIVMYLGLLGTASALFIPIEFLENAHLFGFSIGLVLVGLSFFMAEKPFSNIKPPNVYTGGAALISWTEIHHNIVTMIILLIGVIFTLVFGALISKSLLTI